MEDRSSPSSELVQTISTLVPLTHSSPERTNSSFIYSTVYGEEKNESEARIQSVTWERKASCQETQGLLFYCTDTDTDHIVVHIS